MGLVVGDRLQPQLPRDAYARQPGAEQERLQHYASESPGISVFCKDPGDSVFHTYSCYARGLDMLNGAYHYLDLVPKGRDEAGLAYPQAWVRHHDKYDD